LGKEKMIVHWRVTFIMRAFLVSLLLLGAAQAAELSISSAQFIISSFNASQLRSEQ
jgi:hypothetical protein